MKVNGSHELPAPPERVWQALADHEALGVALPGCRHAEPGPPLELTTAWRVAALDGLYRVRVDLAEADPPASVRLRLDADGERGGFAGTVDAALVGRDGGTAIEWAADCEAEGRLAAVGGQVLAAALQRLAQELFAGVEDHLAGAPAGAPADEPRPSPAAGPPRDWGPLEGGPRPDTERVVVAALAGALCALLLVWLVGRLRGRG